MPFDPQKEPIPRVPQIPAAEEDAAIRAVLEIFEAGPNNHVVRTFAQHPLLAQLFLTYNRYLLRTSMLDPRLRQIAIMRITWTNNATYMWSSHLRMSLKVGMTGADFDAVKHGVDSLHRSALERTVVRAVDEFNADHALSDATWGELTAALGQRPIMDLLFTIGTYALAGFVINTLRIDREPELQALAEQYGAPPWPISSVRAPIAGERAGSACGDC